MDRAVVATSIGVPLEQLVSAAVFKAENPQAFYEFLTLGIGMAMVSAGSAHGIEMMDPLHELMEPSLSAVKLPHHVLVAVEHDRVHLRHSDRHGVVGLEIGPLDRASFKAHLHRGPGSVELHFRAKTLGSEALRGKWGLFHHEAIATARAVVELSV